MYKKRKWKDVLTIISGKNQKAVETVDGKYPIYGSGGIIGHASSFLCPAKTVIVGRKGTIDRPIYVEEPFWNIDTAFGVVAGEELLPKYLESAIKQNSERIRKLKPFAICEITEESP